MKAKLETMVPDIKDPWLIKLLSWADEFRTLGVWANADYPRDARRAMEYGAQGIGLCRSEHMFFETDRLPHFQRMIMTDYPVERREALAALLPFQRQDFAGLFRVMQGRPVIIRLIDPPLHEFLPDLVELVSELADLKIRLKHAADMAAIDTLLAKNPPEGAAAQAGPEPAGGQPHAGSAGGAPGHLHSGTDHHAGAGHLRGGLHGGPKRASMCTRR
jgi:phosphoenolpyruvate synthase/pyruvate phosphate dikinase